MSIFYTPGTQAMKDTEDLPALFAEFEEVRTHVGNAFDAVESALDTIGSGSSTVDSRLDTLDSKVITVNSDVDAVESRVTTAESGIDTNGSMITTNASGIVAVDSKADTIDSSVDTVSSGLDTVDSRVVTLEARKLIVTENDVLPVAATGSAQVLIADRAGSVVTFKAYAQTAAAAAESITVDLKKNGVSVLTGVITIDDVAGVAVQSATIKSDGTEDLVADDKLVVDYTYTAGGAPAPMADICSSVWIEI